MDMKLINWAYMDFQVRVKTTTYLFQIKDEIKSRHGRVTDVVLYRDHVDDDNKLMNDMATFEDMQFKGGLATEDPVVRGVAGLVSDLSVVLSLVRNLFALSSLLFASFSGVASRSNQHGFAGPCH